MIKPRRTSMLAIGVLLGTCLVQPVPAHADGASERVTVQIDRNGEDAFFVSDFDVAASPDACLMAALDFEAINDDSIVLTRVEPSVSLVPQPPPSFEVAYRMSFPGRDINYTLAHELTPAMDELRWTLAPGGSDRIQVLDGRLSVSASPVGCRIAYRSSVRLGWKIPEAIEQRLSQVSLRRYLRGVQRRAEALGTTFKIDSISQAALAPSPGATP